MWIVKNLLRGTLYISDLNLKIAPKDYFDLDSIGRDRAENSRQIKLAFEEGYLQNIKKDIVHGAEFVPGTMKLDDSSRALILDEFKKLRESIITWNDIDEIRSKVDALCKVLLKKRVVADYESEIAELQSLLSERISKEGSNTGIQELKEHLAALVSGQPMVDLKKELAEFKQDLVKDFAKIAKAMSAGDAKKLEALAPISEAEFRAREKLLEEMEGKLRASFDTIGKKSVEDVGTEDKAKLLEEL